MIMNIKNYTTIFYLLVFFILSGQARADSTQLNFTGDITEQSCQFIGINDSKQVDMKQWETTNFTGMSSTTPVVPVSFMLSCGNDTQVYATIEAHSYDNTQGIILLTSGPLSAKGIGIQLLNSSGEALPFYKSISLGTPTGKLLSVRWQARYIQIDDNVVAGDANATATVNFAYN